MAANRRSTLRSLIIWPNQELEPVAFRRATAPLLFTISPNCFLPSPQTARNTLGGRPSALKTLGELMDYRIFDRCRGSGVSPRVAAQVQPFDNVHSHPVERHRMPLDEGGRGRVQAEPGQKRIAAAVSPDLYPDRWAGAEAARMEADRVGHYQGVLRHREGLRLAKPQPMHPFR